MPDFACKSKNKDDDKTVGCAVENENVKGIVQMQSESVNNKE